MAARLSLRTIFGVKSDAFGGVAFADDNTVLVSCGSFVARQGLTARAARTPLCAVGDTPQPGQGPPASESIAATRPDGTLSALAVSASRRYIAVAESAAPAVARITGPLVEAGRGADRGAEGSVDGDVDGDADDGGGRAANSARPRDRSAMGPPAAPQGPVVAAGDQAASAFELPASSQGPPPAAEPCSQPAVALYDARTMARKRVLRLPPALQWLSEGTVAGTLGAIAAPPAWPDITSVDFSDDDALVLVLYSRRTPAALAAPSLTAPPRRARARRESVSCGASFAGGTLRGGAGLTSLGSDGAVLPSPAPRSSGPSPPAEARHYLLATYDLGSGCLTAAVRIVGNAFDGGGAVRGGADVALVLPSDVMTQQVLPLPEVQSDPNSSAGEMGTVAAAAQSAADGQIPPKESPAPPSSPPSDSSGAVDTAADAAAACAAAAAEAADADAAIAAADAAAVVTAAGDVESAAEAAPLLPVVVPSIVEMSSVPTAPGDASDSILAERGVAMPAVGAACAPDAGDSALKFDAISGPVSSSSTVTAPAAVAAAVPPSRGVSLYGASFAPSSAGPAPNRIIGVWGSGCLHFYALKPRRSDDTVVAAHERRECEGATDWAAATEASLELLPSCGLITERTGTAGPGGRPRSYTSLAWVAPLGCNHQPEPAVAVVGTTDGELLVVSPGGRVALSIPATTDAIAAVSAIAATPRGFIVARGASVCEYERCAGGSADANAPSGPVPHAAALDAPRCAFAPRRSFGLPPTLFNDGDVLTAITVSPGVTRLAVVCGTQIGLIDLPTPSEGAASAESAAPQWTHLSAHGVPPHAATLAPTDADCTGPAFLLSRTCAVLDIDVAVRRPLVVSVGVDTSVRVWNAEERAPEFSRTFPDAPVSVAVHPSGYEIALGFPDKLRLGSILDDDIVLTRTVNVKGASHLRFANGGHALAASSGASIAIVDAFGGPSASTGSGATRSGLADGFLTLRGHGGTVTCLEWSPTDATLLSCGLDGAIYEWDVRTGKRCREIVMKGARLRGLALAPIASTESALPPTRAIAGFESRAPMESVACVVYAVGVLTSTSLPMGAVASLADKYVLMEVDMSAGTVTQTVTLPEAPSSVAVVQQSRATLGGAATAAVPRALLIGTSTLGQPGGVLSFVLPITADVQRTRYSCTSAGIAAMRVFADGGRLVLGGLDGSVAIFDLRDGDGRMMAPPMAPSTGTSSASDLVLVAPTEMAERRSAISALQDKLHEMDAATAYATRVRHAEAAAALTAVADTYAAQRVELDAECRRAADALDAMLAGHEEAAAALEAAHQADMGRLAAAHATRFGDEASRYATLAASVDELRVAIADRHDTAAARHAQDTSTVDAACDARLAESRARRKALERSVAAVDETWAEARRQMSEDLATEIEGASRGAVADKLSAERAAALHFKGENGVMKKKYGGVLQSIEDGRTDLAQSRDAAAELKRSVAALEREVTVMRGVIRDKDAAVSERERHIYELKKENQELDKFKFVLDYKIRELKLQVEPREAEIRAMRQQISEVDAELAAYHAANTELDAMIGTLRAAVDAELANTTSLRVEVLRREAAAASFPPVLYALVGALDDPAALHRGLEELRERFSNGRPADGTAPPVAASSAPAVAAAGVSPDATTTERADTTATPAQLALHESTQQLAHLAASKAALEARLAAAARDNAAHKAQLLAANQRVLNALAAVRHRTDELRKVQRTLALDLATGAVVVPARLRALGVELPAGIDGSCSDGHPRALRADGGTSGAPDEGRRRRASAAGSAVTATTDDVLALVVAASSPATTARAAKAPHHDPDGSAVRPRVIKGSVAATKRGLVAQSS